MNAWHNLVKSKCRNIHKKSQSKLNNVPTNIKLWLTEREEACRAGLNVYAQCLIP